MMKHDIKIYCFITLFCISSFSFAQKFKTSVILSPGISWYSSMNPEIKRKKIGLGFSVGIREEFLYSNFFSIGMELQYVNTNGSFNSPGTVKTAIPEDQYGFLHRLTVQSIDAPLFLKLRTNSTITKGIYFYLGTGLSYIFHSERTVDSVPYYVYPLARSANIPSIASGLTRLMNKNNNPIGTAGMLGIGKCFSIKNKIFFIETKYRFDFNKWIYTTVHDPVYKSFEIKRQCLLINAGMTF